MSTDPADFAEVPVKAIRELVSQFTDRDLSAYARWRINRLCAESEDELRAYFEETDRQPAPTLEELGFTSIGTCADCGTPTFLVHRWSHMGQDGIDHRANPDPESIRPWEEP